MVNGVRVNREDGYTPVKSDHVAASECAFSGHDEPDENNGGAETPDPELGYDDALWAMTPAGGNVQSPGQLVALFRVRTRLGRLVKPVEVVVAATDRRGKVDDTPASLKSC